MLQYTEETKIKDDDEDKEETKKTDTRKTEEGMTGRPTEVYEEDEIMMHPPAVNPPVARHDYALRSIGPLP